MSNLKENLEQLIDNIKDGNYNGAETMFNQILQDKMDDRLEAEKIAVASSIFNDEDADLVAEDLEDFDLEDLEEAKKKVEEDEDEDDEEEVEDEEEDDDDDDDDDEEEMKEKKHKSKK